MTPHLSVPPYWFTIEQCELACKNGTFLTAQVSGTDVDVIIWTVTRQHEDQCVSVAVGQADTVAAAKTAAAQAMTVWADTMEGGEEPFCGIMLPPPIWNL